MALQYPVGTLDRGCCGRAKIETQGDKGEDADGDVHCDDRWRFC